MLDLNSSSTYQIPHFVLICFPRFQNWQHWLSIPLALLLFVAIVANITMLVVVWREESLHEPMYYFLSILAAIDLVLCTTTTPKILGILCFDLRTIDLAGCFTQMYFMSTFLEMESTTFLFMAYDRYAAICNPLRYSSVITGSFVGKALLFILGRNILIVLPMPLLAARHRYCSRNIIENCICSNVSVTSLACADNTINRIYQLIIAFGFLGGDFILICLSYCVILWVVLKLQSDGSAMKAFGTCISHLILISFFYSILLVLIFTNFSNISIPKEVPIMLNVLHLLAPPALNPIVYGVRTKEIRQGIMKMLINIQHILKFR
ncbi:olfactory receptor 56A4-like [Ambystoma mexicanum]|uniref:olfactory receptor 56A4-like n=1 Tax=Ambystoma mexicanum TaxID=8296 RepID=UPI0037E86676